MKFLIAVFTICLSVATTSVHAQTVADGWKAYDAGNYEKAKSIFLPLAEAGNVKALNAVGIMYDEGNAYPLDTEQACNWYEKSAKAGYAPAQRNFGICFHEGVGRSLNITMAIHWNELAAKQNYIYSQITLVKLLAERDPDRAMYWGQKAVNQGSAAARVAMWSFDLKNTGRPASYFDIGCVLLMSHLLGKPLNYCD